MHALDVQAAGVILLVLPNRSVRDEHADVLYSQSPGPGSQDLQ